MIRAIIFIGLTILLGACNSTKLIDPTSIQRQSVYIEPNDIIELAEGMVEHIIQSSKLTKITTYSFGKIENRSCEDEFETILISTKIKEFLNTKTYKRYSPNANHKFEGKLFQQCPVEDGKITVTTTLMLQLVDKQDNTLWSHYITMAGKSQKNSWVFY